MSNIRKLLPFTRNHSEDITNFNYFRYFCKRLTNSLTIQMDNSQNIHIIDNSVRNLMKMFDHRGDNYFGETISLIMNFEPYRNRTVLGRPFRIQEHCITLVTRGTATFNFSYNEYTLKEGHLLIIPANSVSTKKTQSNDYDEFSIAFRIPEIEHLNLIDYKESHIALSDTERRMAENHFRLLEQVIKSKPLCQESVNHLILSLLYCVYTPYQETNHHMDTARPDRYSEIMNGFSRLLLKQDHPVRKPDYYAERLNISKGHLADVIKEKTGKTTMDLINERTVLLAQAMLVSTNDTIESIGRNLNIGEASQFTKFFKKHTGQTPNEYRKSMQ